MGGRLLSIVSVWWACSICKRQTSQSGDKQWRQDAERVGSLVHGRMVIGGKTPGEGGLWRERGSVGGTHGVPVETMKSDHQTRPDQRTTCVLGVWLRPSAVGCCNTCTPSESASRNCRRVPPYSMPHPCPLPRNLNSL